MFILFEEGSSSNNLLDSGNSVELLDTTLFVGGTFLLNN